ncbi:MAG: sulfotransferase [Chromatiales bacterium]|nr:sulfotransferase [Chromatiales bacterium]
MQPIFMIGMQRSGSNLLRLMLNQLTEVASPHPPHILQRLQPLLNHYGDLSEQSNFNHLVDDVCRLVELNPVAWEDVRLDRGEVASLCRERSLVALHGAVYDLCAKAWGANSWCCKSLANIHHIEAIEHYFKNPKYIFLYRDGRDVALSFTKAVVGEKHIYHIAENWAKTQEIALSLMDKIGPERLMSISYEELTADPAGAGKRLCDFLGFAYSDAMLEYHRSDEARRAADSSSLWDKVAQPVMQNNTRKFMREFSQEDICIFESVAGHVLDQLGYERVHLSKGEEIAFSEQQIQTFKQENERLKLALKEKVDKDDLQRRERQEALLEEIRTRSSDSKSDTLKVSSF